MLSNLRIHVRAHGAYSSHAFDLGTSENIFDAMTFEKNVFGLGLGVFYTASCIDVVLCLQF